MIQSSPSRRPQAASAPDVQAAMRAALLAARNPDGGWPYYAGKSSRIEPTCAAWLALDPKPEPSLEQVLAAWRGDDGWLVEPGAPHANFGFNGMAALVALNGHAGPLGARLAARLAVNRSSKHPEGTPPAREETLAGWSWSPATWAWVEPTAWCLLTVKRLPASALGEQNRSRVQQADEILLGRAHAEGGWNYGNPNVLGADLHAYVPTTALALLALQDHRENAAVRRGLEFLERNWSTERSGLALSLACIALGVFGRPLDGPRAALESAWSEARFLGNLHVTALALYALAGDGTYAAFTV